MMMIGRHQKGAPILCPAGICSSMCAECLRDAPGCRQCYPRIVACTNGNPDDGWLRNGWSMAGRRQVYTPKR